MENLEEILSELPEIVADKLQDWRMKTLERERVEAILYLKFKGDGEKRTQDELKAMVKEDGGRYQAVLNEIKAESAYNLVYERLLCAKKKASLRTAF
jgi:hypothetical protein